MSVTEFRTGDDVYLFLSVRFKISVTNVGSPGFKVIELSYKGEKSNTTERNNT